MRPLGPRARTILLGVAGVTIGVACARVALLGDLAAHARAFVAWFAVAAVAHAVATAVVARHPPTAPVAVVGIVVLALGYRALLLPVAPTLSTDLYRYLWDGRLTLAGVSPYLAPPSDPRLAGFRDGVVYPRLNHVDWRTVYPPGAQLVFAALAALAPASALGVKVTMVAFDVLAGALLLGWLRGLGQPAAWVLVYAWHPLVVVEVAGMGHLDAVALAASVAALWAASRGREGWAGALLGAGTLVKLYPAVLFPAVASRRPGRALLAGAGVVAAGYALHAGDGPAVLGSLGRYVVEEEFNGMLRSLLEIGLAPAGPAGRLLGRLVPLAGLAALALGLLRWGRHLSPARRARWLGAGWIVAAPSLFPWYVTWLVPFLAPAPSAWPWLGLSYTVALAYLVFAEPVWHIPVWARVVEGLPLLVGLGVAAVRPWRGRRESMEGDP